MNPLASYKCAQRVLMALAAISGIFLAASCGSSKISVPTNPNGFSNSSLSGSYVFTSSGVDSGGFPIFLTGVLVANGTGGNGGITGGTMDVVDAGSAIPPAVAITGSYSVGSDGRGKATLNSSVANFTLDFVLTSTSHGLVTEFDNNGSGSGTLDLQGSVPTLAQLAGPYAFDAAGADSGGGSFATAGSFTLDSSGTTPTPGVQDINDNANLNLDASINVTATVASGTGPGTLTVNGFSFDYYPIDATHLKIIEVDGADFTSGDVFTQTGATIPTTPMVFSMSGGLTSPIANAGVMTYSGGAFSGTEDVNNAPAVLFSIPFSSTTATVGGRLVVTLTNFDPATQWVVYPSSGGLLILETDTLNVTLGSAFAQTGGTFGASQNYGLNLNAFNVQNTYAENDIAQFLNTSTTFKGVVDINDDYGNGSGSLVTQQLQGTYTPQDASGVGSATTTANGAGYVSFNFYVASTSNILILETDTTQVGSGLMQLQSSPSGSAAQSRVSMARPAVLKPAARAKMAARKK
jgi:hypothetical protein